VVGRGRGRDRVHDDPVGAPFAGCGTRDRADRLLRRVVRAEPAAARDAHRRREVHDASPPLRLHVRIDGLHRPERTLDAGAVEDVEVLFAHVGHRRERAERLRVVDEPVDATEVFDGLRDHRVDLFLVLDVADDAEVVDSELAELRAGVRQQVWLPLRDDDARSAAAEMERHTPAHPASRAGHDDDLAVDAVHLPSRH
jgi:hypothetical protein